MKQLEHGSRYGERGDGTVVRILIVSQYFWPENFRINDLALGLKERGNEVCVLTGMPNYPVGTFFDGYGFFSRWKESWNGIEVIRTPLIPRGGGGGVRLTMNYLSFALIASLLAPFRCRGEFDAIFVHEPSPITVGLPAIVMRWLKKAPIYFWVLDLWPESLEATGGVRSPWVLGIVRSMVRWIYKHCDMVLVQSRRFMSAVRDHGVPEERILYFPSWAEVLYRPLPRPQSLDDEFALPEGFRIMFAGNIGAAQDFESILAAAEKLKSRKDIHWLIVGDGRLGEWVRKEVVSRGLGETVHLLGRHPVGRMPEFFAAADAMLVSLRSEPIFTLTIPGKVQSYLACGRPVIAMLDGEGATVIKEAGAGYTCAAGDADGLARLAEQMASLSEEERNDMGRSGRQYYENHFDREILFERLEGWMTKFGAGDGIAAGETKR